MFWSANYSVVRELNVLLKQENVTLTQVLETDDILQECKADNKTLMQFLTKPKILAELITLITEEPPMNVELASQYRHASIACEVLTSHLSTLSDRLSMDVVQMNRLCDFINKDPPLNPLLASYFSKTVEMLLERGPKQDWYLYHMVCLRVLDFFKSRRDFLPNLLRHISTSAIADTFKYFIRLDDLFNKIIMEWFEEHQLLECLIQIICGTYVPEPLAPAKAEGSPDQPEKGQHELSEKLHANHADHAFDERYSNDDGDRGSESAENNVEEAKEAEEESSVIQEPAGAEAAAQSDGDARAARISAVASANAAALLCDLILSGCAGDGSSTRARTSWALVARLQGADAVRQLLQAVFTAPPHARAPALVHATHVLLALLDHHTVAGSGGESEAECAGVELAVAPHLPLLHQALLRPPGAQRGRAGGVGAARVQVAALLARLAASGVRDVCATMLTLGTPGALLQLFLEYENNNFLHAQVAALVAHALDNRLYRDQYAQHLLVECDLLTKLLDIFEENENKKPGAEGAGAGAGGRPRSAYMGHVLGMLRQLGAALDAGAAAALTPAQAARWAAVRDAALAPRWARADTPLGGYYPSDNLYEYNDGTAVTNLDNIPNDINADDANEMCGAVCDARMSENLDFDDDIKAESDFLELASHRFGDDMWEDSPENDDLDDGEDCAGAALLLGQPSPWEASGAGAGGGEGWAHFDSAPAPAPAGGPAPLAGGAGGAGGAAAGGPPEPAPFWAFADDNAVDTDCAAQDKLEKNMRDLGLGSEIQQLENFSVELTTNLLTALRVMAPEVVADIVNNVPMRLAAGFHPTEPGHDTTQHDLTEPGHDTPQHDPTEPDHDTSQHDSTESGHTDTSDDNNATMTLPIDIVDDSNQSVKPTVDIDKPTVDIDKPTVDIDKPTVDIDTPAETTYSVIGNLTETVDNTSTIDKSTPILNESLTHTNSIGGEPPTLVDNQPPAKPGLDNASDCGTLQNLASVDKFNDNVNETVRDEQKTDSRRSANSPERILDSENGQR